MKLCPLRNTVLPLITASALILVFVQKEVSTNMALLACSAGGLCLTNTRATFSKDIGPYELFGECVDGDMVQVSTAVIKVTFATLPNDSMMSWRLFC